MAQTKKCVSVISLQEAEWDSKKGRLQLRVIQAGHPGEGQAAPAWAQRPAHYAGHVHARGQ